MASPYVFNAPYEQAPYQGAYYTYPQHIYSPFIPDTSRLPPSPYSNANSLPGSPNRPTTALPGGGVAFPSMNSPYSAPAYTAWPQRERRPSWHTPPPDGPYLQSPTYFHQRRNSDVGGYFPNAGQYYNPVYAPVTPFSPGFSQLPINPNEFDVHPWLNGESPRNDFIFDLSAVDFYPQRLVGPGQTIPIPHDQLAQAATHPPIHRLHITHDSIPQWPIDLTYNAYFDPTMPEPPPITVYDVLKVIHEQLHTRISHVDWARLSQHEEHAISRQYTRRCRAAGSTEMALRNEGVKRIDFLLGKVWFRGLVRETGGPGWERVRLITA